VAHYDCITLVAKRTQSELIDEFVGEKHPNR
jgi:hypothetical protein